MGSRNCPFTFGVMFLMVMVMMMMLFPSNSSITVVRADVVHPSPIATHAADSSAYPPAYFKGLDYNALRAQYMPGQAGWEAIDNACSAYCDYPLDDAAACNLSESRLPEEKITPQNKHLPAFSEDCFCKGGYGPVFMLEWTPLCLWCLTFYNVAIPTRDLLHQAYLPCTLPPYNLQPCSSHCGNLTLYLEVVVKPCELTEFQKDTIPTIGEVGSRQRQRYCRCTVTVKTLVESCRFCWVGWDVNVANGVTQLVEGCDVQEGGLGGVIDPTTGWRNDTQQALSEEDSVPELVDWVNKRDLSIPTATGSPLIGGGDDMHGSIPPDATTSIRPTSAIENRALFGDNSPLLTAVTATTTSTSTSTVTTGPTSLGGSGDMNGFIPDQTAVTSFSGLPTSLVIDTTSFSSFAFPSVITSRVTTHPMVTLEEYTVTVTHTVLPTGMCPCLAGNSGSQTALAIVGQVAIVMVMFAIFVLIWLWAFGDWVRRITRRARNQGRNPGNANGRSGSRGLRGNDLILAGLSNNPIEHGTNNDVLPVSTPRPSANTTSADGDHVLHSSNVDGTHIQHEEVDPRELRNGTGRYENRAITAQGGARKWWDGAWPRMF